MQPDVSIVIVNWNSVELLKKCLASIYRYTFNLSFEIIIVDNASYDGSAAYCQKYYPDILFIQSPENLGFAKANNLGFKHSRGEYMVFLNPDTELMDNAFFTMFSYARQFPEVGALGCTLLNSDHSLQYTCYQFFPTLLNEILELKGINLVKQKKVFTRPLLKYSTGDYDVYPAQIICGACFFVKREVFEAVGKFTEVYFMYAEDMDLSYKIYKQGYISHFLRNVKIIHHGGKSTSQITTNFFSVSMQKKSRYLFYDRERGILYARLFKLSMLFTSLIRLSLIALFMPAGLVTAKRIKIMNAWGKWLTIFRWAISSKAKSGIK